MQTDPKRLTQRIAGGILLIALFVAVFLVWDYRVKARGKSQPGINYVESHDFGTQMVNYTKQGRYEDAIQVGLHALQNQPSDGHREEWVTVAVSNVENYPSTPRSKMSQALS